MKSADAPSRADFHEAISNRSDRWYAACLKITRNPDLAEDAVQEALLSAWKKRHQFQHTSRLETWIHRIAVNAALQLLRKSRPGVFEPLEIEITDDGQGIDLSRIRQKAIEKQMADRETLEKMNQKEIIEMIMLLTPVILDEGNAAEMALEAKQRLEGQM